MRCHEDCLFRRDHAAPEPPGFERLLQTPQFVATFGGGEANVAVSLAQFGCESHYVTRLPAHAIGEAAIRVLRAEGVRTEHILRGGDRVGIYYAEAGASQRASQVIYDRARSSIAQLTPGTVDWAAIFDGASWFHCTGITPALGADAAACTREALEAAKAAGVRVSVDLNFRRKLWTEAQAQATMRPLMEFVDVIVANEEDVQSVLGFEVAGNDVTSGNSISRPTRRRPGTWRRPSTSAMSPSRCARATRPATTAGAPSSTSTRQGRSITASTTTFASWIA